VKRAGLLLPVVRSLVAKAGELKAAGRFSHAARTAAGLLLRGRFREFREKLFSHTPLGTMGSAWSFPVPGEAERRRMSQEAALLPDPPLISVLLPVYNSPEHCLRRALDSVFAQIYPHWELCISDDCSTARHVPKVLEECVARDRRIKVVQRPRNGNISAATNSALELATGQYAALLDHDDELAAQALLRAAQAIVADRSVDMLYSDEDKLNLAGAHVDPFFKPEWSPEYFLSCMYTCHLGVYRTALLRELGGFRSEYDSAQDYDLVLRLMARTSRIRHIPEVLYHWRISPSSTALNYTAKPHAHLVARRALAQHLQAAGQAGTVEPGPAPGFHRVRRQIAGRPKVSVIIATACRSTLIRGAQKPFILNCVESIRSRSTYENREILVVHDKALPAGLEKQLAECGAAGIACGEDLNLPCRLNFGAEQAGGSFLLFLHDDVEATSPDWIECLLECLQDDGVGAAGGKLFFPDGRLQHVGLTVLGGSPKRLHHGAPGNTPGYFNSNIVQRNCTAVSGACLMTRAEIFRAAGEFSTAFPWNYYDADFCLKALKRGKRIVFTPYAQACHYEAASRPGPAPSEIAEFQSRWAGACEHDPYCVAQAQVLEVVR